MDTWTDADWQLEFEERAAIMEFDGGLPRAEAELLVRGRVLALRAAQKEG